MGCMSTKFRAGDKVVFDGEPSFQGRTHNIIIPKGPGPFEVTADEPYVEIAGLLYDKSCVKHSVESVSTTSTVDHPKHYGGDDNPYEAIKVIEAWDLGFCLGNVVKYLSRAGKKTKSPVEDLRKAAWYLNREIERLEREKDGAK